MVEYFFLVRAGPIMTTNWKNIALNKAQVWLAGGQTPLVLKELGWKVVVFAAKCGKSNPISFIFRLVFDHQRIRTGIGLALVLGVLSSIVFIPSASLAANIGGKLEIATVSDGDVSPKTNTAVQIPLPTVDISQGFWLLHPAIDLVTPIGTPIRPVMAGKVKTVTSERFGYGNYVVVDHGNGYESLYAHQEKVLVKEGQEVGLETILGESGSTGRSTGPHLHLEIHYEGKAVNPAQILGIK